MSATSPADIVSTPVNRKPARNFKVKLAGVKPAGGTWGNLAQRFVNTHLSNIMVLAEFEQLENKPSELVEATIYVPVKAMSSEADAELFVDFEELLVYNGLALPASSITSEK